MTRLLDVTIVISACLIMFLVNNSNQANGSDATNDRNDVLSRPLDKLPKLFDWAEYKKLFHKVYSNFKEEMIRKKLHLVNSLRTFMHNILYRWSKISYFLAITHFADWTIHEIDSMYKFKGFQPINEAKSESDANENKSKSTTETNEPIVLPELNEEELGAEMQNTIANKEPGFELLQTELVLRDSESQQNEHDKQEIKTNLLRMPYELRYINTEEELKGDGGISLDYREDDQIELPATPILNEEVVFGDDNDMRVNNNNNNRIKAENKPDQPIHNHWARLSNIIFNKSPGDAVIDDTDDKVDILPPSLYNFISKVPKMVTDYVLTDYTKVDRYTDWRTSGCLSMPRRQYQCGSCYAFATIAYLEWAHCKDTGVLMSFSEQFMVDCGVHSNLNQCDGGYLEQLGDFVLKYGVELRENYPYTAQAGRCPFKKADKLFNIGYAKPTVKKWTIVGRNKWHTVLDEVGPMITGIHVPSDFQHYGGHIHTGHNCDPERGHAMLLVGHGIENGVPYWIFKNSHGFYWGEYGYFKLSKLAKGNCFIAALLSEVTFNNNTVVTKTKTLNTAADKYKLFRDKMMLHQ